MAPMSGYDIRQWFERSLGFFWNESYGQIYPILKRLEQKGYARVQTVAQTERPARKVYRISERGRRALREWLATGVTPDTLRLELLLKIFFGRAADPTVPLGHLRGELEESQKHLKVFQSIEKELMNNCSDPVDSRFSLITLRYGLGLMRHNIRWARESLELLESDRQRLEVYDEK